MPTILLVDDEPNIRWTMAEFLKREQYEVLTASDFESALAVFSENEIDVSVVDIVLPRKSGIHLLEELHSRQSDLPIIMMTGEPNISHLPDIVRAGAYDFLTKPVTKEVLLKAVERACEKKRLQDEKSKLEKEIAQHAEQLEVTVAERTAELLEARNFLKAVLDSSTEYAILVTDLKGDIVLFNRGAELMFQYEAERVLGRSAWALICDEGEGAASQNPLCLEGTTEEQHAVQELEIKMKRRDGSRFIASIATTTVQTASGHWLGRLAIIKDLTIERQQAEELRQMQEQLTRNEKIAVLGRMAAQVTHEVRNPLAGLRLYAMHLKGKVADKLSESEMSLIEKILKNVDHLADTTEQILNVARPLNLTLQPKRIEPIINDCLQLVESQISSSRVEVKLDLATETTILIDEASIRSALVNILLNSIQAMPTGGILAITSRNSDDQFLLTIADTGSGMTIEQAEKVFEPFYTTKSAGLGLGMPFAKRIIEQHHGSIQVRSHPGEGTAVEIKLPVAG